MIRENIAIGTVLIMIASAKIHEDIHIGKANSVGLIIIGLYAIIFADFEDYQVECMVFNSLRKCLIFWCSI